MINFVWYIWNKIYFVKIFLCVNILVFNFIYEYIRMRNVFYVDLWLVSIYMYNSGYGVFGKVV